MAAYFTREEYDMDEIAIGYLEMQADQDRDRYETYLDTEVDCEEDYEYSEARGYEYFAEWIEELGDPFDDAECWLSAQDVPPETV